MKESMSEQLQLMLNAFKSEIYSNDWDTIINTYYDKVKEVFHTPYIDYDLPTFISFLFDNDVDFLHYVAKIPDTAFIAVKRKDLNIVIPANVKEIANVAFGSCNFNSVVFKCSADAFNDNYGFFESAYVPYVKLPDDMKVLNNSFFQACAVGVIDGLDHLETLEQYSLAGTPIKEFTCGQHFKDLKVHAISGCNDLEKVDLSHSIETVQIEEASLIGCPKLMEIDLPKKFEIFADSFAEIGKGCHIIVPLTYGEFIEMTGYSEDNLSLVASQGCVFDFTDKSIEVKEYIDTIQPAYDLSSEEF